MDKDMQHYVEYLKWLAARGIPCYEGDLRTARGMCGVMFEMMAPFFSNSELALASYESFERTKSVIEQISALPDLTGSRYSEAYSIQSECALRIVQPHLISASYDDANAERIARHIADYCLGCERGLRFLDASKLEDAWAEFAEAQFHEGMVYGLASSTRNDRSALREQAIKAADARHSENRAIKAQAIEYYLSHRDQFSSKDAAASWMEQNLVPVKFRTIRAWLTGV